MKLFLDDIRSIPSGYKGVRSYEEYIRFMKNNKGKINEISLDYDLEEMKIIPSTKRIIVFLF